MATLSEPVGTGDSYDEIPYESLPFPLTHPDNLAVVATLFGMHPAPVAGARVLELGCASGGNLVPLAATLPGGRFHGVDRSGRQIAEGRETVASLGLANVTLEQADIASVSPGPDRYDYVICHGVYSWVPDSVQGRILEICRAHLAEQGVAYVSYNTFPGWHLRAGVREMMNFHADRFADTAERIEQARALLDFLGDAVPAQAGAFGMLLADELEVLRSRSDAYLFHEHLEAHNDPVYFHRFVARAAAAGLQYLGEARLADMLPAGQFPAETEDTLRRVAPDLVHMEQYLDFLRNRMFRRTLLCHQEVALEREVGWERVAGLYVSGCLEPEAATEDAPPPPGGYRYRDPDDGAVTVFEDCERAALGALREAWPRSLEVRELAGRAAEITGGEGAAVLRTVSELVLNCYSAGLVALRSVPDRFSLAPAACPRAAPLARLQAKRGGWVTNLRHEAVDVDRLGRFLLERADGAASRVDLRDALLESVQREEIRITRDGEPLVDGPDLDETIAAAVDHGLERLAGQALLLA